MKQNKQLVLDFYEAGARGDTDACFALLSDDISWTNIGSTRFSGTFQGKQSLAENLLGPLFAQLKAGISTKIERLISEDDIVVAQTVGTAETVDGLPYNNRYCQVIRISDGKIASVTEYMDTALIDSIFGKTDDH
ncbi:nuclear transport factor 2 family protein [Pseudohongiella sp. SYSU M77423]|uniref:nuclear transport factor 2 family protein n=1 Tax=unclassified Pseudohongiella TaxID=2629611 RepID=UPI001F3B0B64|nr:MULTISPECIES: nuclear transport factor 2 family protein [unclassified Pseudohongiella]MDH7943428.1 nuclear transport factor 2 family protein [Pseudohongiella sp. SYSU M77423]